MIKAIILDLGNVIIPLDFERCHDALAGACSHPPAEIPGLLASTGLPKRFESGEISPENFVREVSAILDLKISHERFLEIWGSILRPEILLPESMLEGLCRERRLLLLSNTNALHIAVVREKFPMLRHFHDLILSYEVGALKPSPRIYREAIARAGCRPEECFFTDDIAAYVDGARREGIDAVQFQSLRQIEEELRNRGVRW